MSSCQNGGFRSDKRSKFKVTSCISRECVSFEWRIENFSLCRNKVDERIVSPTFSSLDSTWELWLYPKGETERYTTDKIGIYLRRISSDKTDLDVVLRVCLKDDKNADAYTFQYEHNFKGHGEVVGRGHVIERSVLLGKKKAELLPDDVLTIFCELTIGKDIVHGTAICISDNANQKYSDVSALDNLSNDFSSLYESSKLYDVILKADHKEFPVHKAILSARSPVFAAMFEHDMEEKRSSEVNISDLEASALKSFLYFIYSGKINEMSMEKAISLFKIADKYVVNELKTKCMYFISSYLSIDNFCEIAVLGDTYSEEKLKDSVKDFLYEKELEAVVTSQWEALLRDKPRLAAELLQAVCVNRRKNQKK